MIGSFDQERFNHKGTGMKKFVDLYCDFDDFCKVFIPQWPKQLLEDGIAKEVKERWDDFMDLCFTLSLIIKLK